MQATEASCGSLDRHAAKRRLAMTPECVHAKSGGHQAEAKVRGVVKKWGNSAAVRIPAAVLEAAQLRLDQPVDVREEGGRVVIAKLETPSYDIAVLIAGITEENRHDPVDMGKPIA